MECDMATDTSDCGLGHQGRKARVSAARSVDTNVLLYAENVPSLGNAPQGGTAQACLPSKRYWNIPPSKVR